ncbi:MAG TPA: epoxyqueuosine reductase QueH [Desulfobacteraceae bacterium]|nr:epoxyqueuosine reductase QueH [Desulfobacteraceae bacterium]
MNILLHVCCGPCTVYPLEVLRAQGNSVEGFFFNPNIHPYREFRRRINALRELADMEKFPVKIVDNYGLREYLRQVVFNEQERCSICYDMRLEAAARIAGETGADAFTTTLLYSRYQNHEQIREKGEQLAEKFGVAFHYQDFRIGWRVGIDRSKEMGLYRQPYCGCIYSEQERYDKKLRKKIRK